MSFPPGTEMFQFSGFASPKPILFSLVILISFKTEPDCSGSVLNGTSGLSHSEIAGSKLAHSSPTLIAACHVLHRLYMPRHSPDALTSRLRVHTTNDNTGDSVIAACIGVVIKLSQIIIRVRPWPDLSTAPLRKRPENRTRVATASIKKPIHNVKERRKRASYYRPKPANRYSSSLEILAGDGGAYRDRTDDLMLAKQPLSQLS